MVVHDLLSKVSDLYYEFRFPGWNEARESAEEALAYNEKREARRVLRNFASQVAQNGKKPILSYSGIRTSLRLAKSLQDLEQRCLVMGKMSNFFKEREAWWTACARGYISRYVDEALDILEEHGDFSLTYNYTPPKPYTYTTTETVEYGGTGVNAYWREEQEVEKTGYTLEKLEVNIVPPDKGKSKLAPKI